MTQPARPTPWAFSVALSLLALFFYLSVIFLPLTALPLLYLRCGSDSARTGRIWLALSVLLGTIFCFNVNGGASAMGYLLIGIIPAGILGELLTRKVTVERSVLVAMLVLFGVIGLMLNSWSMRANLSVLDLIRQEGTATIVTAAKSALEQQQTQLTEESRKLIEDLRDHPEAMLRLLPGTLAALVLLLCSIPVIGLIRWNPKRFRERIGVKRDYIRRWRNPDWFVWPTLACLAILIFQVGNFDVLALTLLLPLSFLYFYQGMAIISFFLDLFHTRGPLRLLFYVIAFFYPPIMFMVASFGFFDLWFNFRDRLRPKAPKA